MVQNNLNFPNCSSCFSLNMFNFYFFCLALVEQAREQPGTESIDNHSNHYFTSTDDDTAEVGYGQSDNVLHNDGVDSGVITSNIGIVHHPPVSFWDRLRHCEPRNTSWYTKRTHYAVYMNSMLSLAMMAAMWIEDVVALGRDVADRMCKKVKASLPQPNIFPRSIHILRQLVGSEEASKYTYHVCKNECHTWEWLATSEWESKRHQTCPHCNTPRFKVSTVNDPLAEDFGTRDTLQPQRVRSNKVQNLQGVHTFMHLHS